MYRLGRILARPLFLVIYSISCFPHTITTFSEFGEDSNISENYFIVTAYYSPLENQEDYITGSYAGDIRLNGSGIRGASGKEVFPGMIAAPKKYPFGTKIEIEGLGIGSVEDRGGAIVEAKTRGHAYDRLDIWMGFGDQGRKRAILWGARKVKGEIVDSKKEVTIQFSDSLGLDLFGSSVGPDSSEADIKKLQEFLVSLKMYSGHIDGEHSSIRDTIIEYQLKNGIIKTRDDEEAGYFGLKTIAQIKKEFPTASLKVGKKETSVEEKQAPERKYFSVINNDINSTSKSEQIKELQSLFQFIGLYSGAIDGNYESIKKTITDYQLKKKIISSKNSFGAGNFGPKTRSFLQKEFSSLITSKEKEASIEQKQVSLSLPSISITPASKSDSIKLLQSFMKGSNIYSGEIDGKYESIKSSLIDYQIKNKIISSPQDEAAGYYGVKTREKMKQEF